MEWFIRAGAGAGLVQYRVNGGPVTTLIDQPFTGLLAPTGPIDLLSAGTANQFSAWLAAVAVYPQGQGSLIPPSGCVATSPNSLALNSATARGQLAVTTSGTSGTAETSTSVITIDGTLYRQAQLTSGGAGPTSVVIDATYGPLVQGVQQVHLQSADGVTFTGTVDGRAVVPFTPSSTSPSYTFADGNPAPTVTVAADIQTEVDSLIASASNVACPSTFVAPTVASALKLSAPLRTEASRVTPMDQGNNDIPVPAANDDFNVNASAACDNCTNQCSDATYICQTGAFVAAASCAWFAEICAAAGLATCLTTEGVCMGYIDPSTGCYGSGGACHPGNTCGSSTVCSTNGDNCTPDGHCCGANNLICGDECCKSGIFECNQDSCCPSATTPCGGECCGAGEACTTSGYCCAPGVVACGSACCGAGENCGDSSISLCCPEGQAASNGICCPTGTSECNGACCLAGDCQQGALTSSAEVCCATPLCGGSCCDGAIACVNGQCCYGAVADDGTCCPLGESVCGGACCAGSCGINGQCCPPGSPECGVPSGTSLLFWDSTANTASPGSATCGGSPCQVVYWGSSITLHGAGFVAGVPVTMPVPGAATVSIVPDSTGQFTVTITPSGSGDIDEPVSATQTSGSGQLSASALVAFEDSPP